MSLISPSEAPLDESRIRVYFNQCDGNKDKVKCNLCSIEVSSKSSTEALWNHIYFKHVKDTQPIACLNNKQWKFKKQHKSKSPRRGTSILNDSLNDTSIDSIKPLPSSSLSKNLISRLNQISSPVARKLKFWNKKSFQVNQYDPSFKVIYLGNLGMQLWSKDESCLDKPLSALWNNYVVNMKTEIVMRLTICNSGLKAITRQHGLTQYWSNRLVYCCSHKNYPRIFSWVYRHEGKKMRQELRCHAVFCSSSERASKMVILLNQRLACALQEFRREKKSRGPSVIDNNISSAQQRLPRTIPLRRQILAKGSANFRPPLDRSKSAPKLTSIVEEESTSDEQESHEDFDYEETFNDQDDDDDDDYSDQDDAYDESENVCEENGSVKQNADSNSSFSNTVNEEVSNISGSDHVAEQDGIGQSDGRSISDENIESTPVDCVTINRLPMLSHGLREKLDKSSEKNRIRSPFRAEESVKLNSDYSLGSQKDELIRQSSANNNTSCSLTKELMIDDYLEQQTVKSNADTTRASNVVEPPDQDLNELTQDVLISWSKLVIK